MNEMPSMFVNRLLLADCVRATQMLPDECIHLTVTSCPYDGLREYGGHTYDFEVLAKELYRITVPGGVVVWNVQEQIKKGSQSGTSSVQRLKFLEIGFNLHDLLTFARAN